MLSSWQSLSWCSSTLLRAELRPMNIPLLGLGTLVLIPLSVAAIFLYAPTERVQGDVQRIFYLHLPLAWIAYLAFFLVFVSSVLYLWKRANRWDLLPTAAAEAGVV